MKSGIFGIVSVLGAQKLVFPLQLASSGIDALERGDVGHHVLLGNFAEILFAEQAFEFIAQADELWIARIEVASEALAGAAEVVLEFIGDDHFRLGDFPEGKDHVLEGDIEEVGIVVLIFQSFALVEKIEMIVGLGGKPGEHAEIELVQ